MYTEQELVSGCKRHSQTHQKALYDRYAGKMFAVCLRYASDRMLAEDFLQEGFIKVFSRLGQFNGDGSLEGWIRRVIVNTALEHIRREKMKIAEWDINEETDDRLVTREDALENMAVDEIVALINNLPTGYRLVFNLYVLEQYSHKEIAIELGITEGTSKSQLARARALLQKMIKKNEYSWNERYAEPKLP